MGGLLPSNPSFCVIFLIWGGDGENSIFSRTANREGKRLMPFDGELNRNGLRFSRATSRVRPRERKIDAGIAPAGYRLGMHSPFGDLGDKIFKVWYILETVGRQNYNVSNKYRHMIF